MCKFPTMLKMIFWYSCLFFFFWLPAILDFLPSLLTSFLHLYLLPSSLVAHYIYSGREKECWCGSCLPINKTVFIVYYLTVSIRHKGLDTSYSQTPFLFHCLTMTLQIVDIQPHSLNWNGLKWKPSTFLRLDWE